MTNEDIIYTLEEFVRWGEGDKRKVIRSLSHKAVENLIECLKSNTTFQSYMDSEIHYATHHAVAQAESSWAKV